MIEIDSIRIAIMNINTCPDPWDLRYFQDIAHTGNLSRSAERLGVGQPALSLALKRLEDVLQVKLFLRRSRGLLLTTSGQRLLRESNQLLASWQAVVSETKRSHTELVGRFTMGCHPSVAIYALKSVIRDIYSNYPRIEIDLVHNSSRIVCEGVISGRIDFGIVVNPIRHSDLIIHKLAADEVGFWGVSGGLDNVLIYNPDMLQAQAILKKLKQKENYERTIYSENLEVIAMLAGSGAGIAILPTRVVRAMAPSLRRLEKYPHYTDEVTFVYRADLPKTASTKCILDFLKSIAI